MKLFCAPLIAFSIVLVALEVSGSQVPAQLAPPQADPARNAPLAVREEAANVVADVKPPASVANNGATGVISEPPLALKAESHQAAGHLVPRQSDHTFVKDIVDRLHALDADIGKLLYNSTSMYAPDDQSSAFIENTPKGGEKFTEVLVDLDSLQDEIGRLVTNATRSRQYNMLIRLRPLNTLLYRIRHNLHLMRNSLVAINTVAGIERLGNSVIDSTLQAFMRPDANLTEELGDSGNYDIDLDKAPEGSAVSGSIELSQTTSLSTAISTSTTTSTATTKMPPPPPSLPQPPVVVSSAASIERGSTTTSTTRRPGRAPARRTNNRQNQRRNTTQKPANNTTQTLSSTTIVARSAI